VDNVVQSGFALDPRTGDIGLNTEIQHRFKLFADNPDECHMAGEEDLTGIISLGTRSMIVAGDSINLLTRSGAIDTPESYRFRTPKTKRNVHLGVLVDGHGKHLEYWAAKSDGGVNGRIEKVGDIKVYKTRDANGNRQVTHLYDPRRFHQRRGITAFAPIADAIGMHDDIQLATLVHQQTVSAFALIEESTGSIIQGGKPNAKANAIGAVSESQNTDGSTKILEGISPGMHIKVAPGKKLTMSSPQVPAGNFFPHTLLILQFIAINLSMPLQILLLDPTKTNFSGWRGAMDQARMSWKRIQRRIIGRMYKPIYEWKVRQFMADDPAMFRAMRSNSKINPMSHAWHPPAWSYIEPLKDVSSQILEAGNPTTSLRRVATANGRQFQEVVTERCEDVKFAVELAMDTADKINAANPEQPPISWREVWNPPSNKDIQITLSDAGDDNVTDNNTDKQGADNAE
ncbi:MAG: phage portal protein, partial [Phycisphaeraceae bacterium]|nr:phage portal protein [Phycisphaeraceae bacterium]